MKIEFTVTFEVNDEKCVPHFRQYLAWPVIGYKRPWVVYHGPVADQIHEEIEYTSWERGEIEL